MWETSKSIAYIFNLNSYFIEEVLLFFLFCKLQVLDEISEHGIRIYQLPDADSDEDEEFKEQTRVLKASFTPNLLFCCSSFSSLQYASRYSIPL